MRQSVTKHIADGGPPIPAQLEEDELHMLWLVQRNRRNSGAECRSCYRLHS
jgi:hypothetical protein